MSFNYRKKSDYSIQQIFKSSSKMPLKLKAKKPIKFIKCYIERKLQRTKQIF